MQAAIPEKDSRFFCILSSQNPAMKKTLFLFLFAHLAFAQSSSLPIILINTNGTGIVDEPKIKATMEIIDNGEGATNKIGDKPAFSGYIGIEYRGSSSQSFPKKPYGLETWTAEGIEVDTSLFGWPSESDWILFASYNEKSLIHNVLSMRIGREMGLYASRTKYVELYLNNNYEGVYVFMEKIKRNKGRVDIAKLNPDEASGDDLTGGYIFKIDKNTGSNNGSWKSNYSNLFVGFKPSEFFYEYPKDITSIQRDYIKNFVGEFEKALKSDNFTDPVLGYRPYIDVTTFVKVTILNEVSKNVDGYRISTFFYKDKDSKDGRLKMGPPWDYDISYGNADYCEGWLPSGFSYNFNKVCPQDNWFVPFWWERFLSDPAFIADLRTEYDYLRENGILKEENLMNLIDELAAEIRIPQQRNFQRWPILGTYVWPSPRPVQQTWQGEVDELKSWLKTRLKWLDDNLPSEFIVLANQPEVAFKLTAYPNPFINSVSLDLIAPESGLANVQLTDILGRIIENKNYEVIPGNNVINLQLPEASLENLQLLKVTLGDQVITQRLLRK